MNDVSVSAGLADIQERYSDSLIDFNIYIFFLFEIMGDFLNYHILYFQFGFANYSFILIISLG